MKNEICHKCKQDFGECVLGEAKRLLLVKKTQAVFDRREIVQGELNAQKQMVHELEIACREKKNQ